jgi:hypothetical protein
VTLQNFIEGAVLVAVVYVIYQGVTSPRRGPWDARRITAAVISALIVALAVVVYLLGPKPK